MKNYLPIVLVVALFFLLRPAAPKPVAAPKPSPDHKLIDSLKLKIEKIEALLVLMKAERPEPEVVIIHDSVPMTDLHVAEVSKPAEQPVEIKQIDYITKPDHKPEPPPAPPKPVYANPVPQPVYYQRYQSCSGSNCGTMRTGLFGRRR